MLTIFNPTLQKICESYVNEVHITPEMSSEDVTKAFHEKRVKEPYNPRLLIPKVRGGWTKEKIKRNMSPSASGIFKAAKFISEYDSVEDLKKHMFYHGTSYGTSKGMIPSIKRRASEIERYGGGGYGERYWGISITPSKKIASHFSHPLSEHVTIYPILLAKHAVVEDAPQFSDANEVEDVIEDYWNRGVDAIRLGKSSEEELLVLNPMAICNIGNGDFYKVYRLGQESNPIRTKSDDDIAKMYEFAKEFVNEHQPSGKPIKPSQPFYSQYQKQMVYPKRDSSEYITKEEYERLMEEYNRQMEEYARRGDVIHYEEMKRKAQELFRF